MAMVLLQWLIAVTPGGYSLLKSAASARAGLIQVKILNRKVGSNKWHIDLRRGFVSSFFVLRRVLKHLCNVLLWHNGNLKQNIAETS